jgi:ubiquitin carboxyl-terminal hydrolase 16/45
VIIKPVSTVPKAENDLEHERSSERTGNNTEEETYETNETGASSNGDVEDNDCEEDNKKWVLSKNLLNNLQKLDNLMMNNDNLDPRMQELCKGFSSLRMENSKIIDKEKQQKQRVKAEWTARTLTSLAPRYLSSPGECSIYSCLNNFTQSELLTGPNKWACESCTENRKLTSAENSDCSSSSSKKSSTVYSSASKQVLLFSPPAVLTLHLKRFQQTLSGCKKVNKHVTFPLELDLAAFCSSTSIAMPNVSLDQRKVLYSLYGVVEHSGRLQGGHYTAFVKVRAANNIVKDPSKLFSPPTSKASDVPNFFEEIEGKFKNNERIVGEVDNEEEPNNNLTLNQSRRWYHVSDSSVSEVSEEKVLKAQAYLLFYERIL